MLYAQLFPSSLGARVSCCEGLRDSWPSYEAFCFSAGVRHPNVVGYGAVEDLNFRRRPKSVQQRLPLPVRRVLRRYPLEGTRFFSAASDGGTRSVTAQREILPASPPSDLLQIVLNRWFPAKLPSWIAKLPFKHWIIISLLTSSLCLYTPTADAWEFFTPKAAGNGAFVSGNKVAQNLPQDGEAFRARVSLAIDLLEKGQNAQAQGDFTKALSFYEEVKQTAGDLALAEYARVGHALTLYEVGDRSEAIIEMEDVSIALRGYPEIHAALAAALYVDKHAPLPAEKQFNIATLLDPRYTNVKWVQETKHWPPSLINSLKRFISLQ